MLVRRVPGLDWPSVLRRLSHLWLPLGRRVVVIGGGLVGVELAEFLVERGRTVTVLEESPWLAPQMAIPRRWRSLHALREHGVELRTQVRVERIDDDGVHFRSADGEAQRVACEHVILAAGATPDSSLADRLGGSSPVLRTIGDCDGVRYLEGAIADGQRAGLEV